MTTMTKCKHGLIIGTCAMCAGIITPGGTLQCEWINLCDDTFNAEFKNNKSIPDQDIWFENNRQSLTNKFYLKWKQKPPYPTWPER